MPALAPKVMTVHELLSTVNWSRVASNEPRSRAVLCGIEAGAKAAAREVIVKRPVSYERKQLAFGMRYTAG